ncbi:cation:proton antiporter domain-containing protein [Tsukamurella soli]|uniref:Cation:proton antiporter n=1 Tax=Tsukamurella soli TaxID=644556 RepID=A0ABP8K7E7_9ACTN
MIAAILCAGVALVGWALLAEPLARRGVAAPMVLVLAGALLGLCARSTVADTLNTAVALRCAEIILAVLLFVEATDVRGGLLGAHPRTALRALLVALPIGLAGAIGAGLILLPHTDVALLLVIACVVAPVDFAPAPSLLLGRGVPTRVRDILKVEAGYADGILSPLIVFALAWVGVGAQADSPLDALANAAPAALEALLVGAVIGTSLAAAMNATERHHLSNARSRRLILVAAPLLAWAAAVGIGGNGFVAAFVCGVAFRYFRRSAAAEDELEFVDDVGAVLTTVMWFVFGVVAVYSLWSGVPLRWIVYAVATLTVVRLAAFAIAMVGSGLRPREIALLGWLGPRGTSTIVFGLIAYNELPDADAARVAEVMTVTVLASIVLHGIGTPLTAGRRERAVNPPNRS